jgi:hypothetical protein
MRGCAYGNMWGELNAKGVERERDNIVAVHAVWPKNKTNELLRKTKKRKRERISFGWVETEVGPNRCYAIARPWK